MGRGVVIVRAERFLLSRKREEATGATRESAGSIRRNSLELAGGSGV